MIYPIDMIRRSADTLADCPREGGHPGEISPRPGGSFHAARERRGMCREHAGISGAMEQVPGKRLRAA